MRKWTGQERTGALCGGGAALAAVLLTRTFTGGAQTILHSYNAAALVPPLWIMGLLWFGLIALSGAALGARIADCHRGAAYSALLWRGATALVLADSFGCAWYALLFGKGVIAFSALCLLLCAGSALLCALSWWQIARAAAAITGLYAAFSLFLLFLQLAVLLRN